MFSEYTHGPFSFLKYASTLKHNINLFSLARVAFYHKTVTLHIMNTAPVLVFQIIVNS